MIPSDIKVIEIPMSDIFYDEAFNCRGKIPIIDVVDLAKDIDAQGLMNPILVQPWQDGKYRIVCGHRRYMAFRVLKRETIPAIIKENLDEKAALTLNLCENLKRKDLNMLQEAEALARFINAGIGQFEIAERVGMSRGWVQSRCELLTLPPEVQEAASAGFLTAQHVRELYNLPKEEQFTFVRDLKERRLRGEKQRIFVKRPVVANKKRLRNKAEILDFMAEIQEAIGNGFFTRVLAWAIGEISDLEVRQDLETQATKYGKVYVIPDHFDN